jgi:hypothetical protein
MSGGEKDMDMAIAILLVVFLIIVPLGTVGVHMMKYADRQSARLEAYSRLSVIADTIWAYSDYTQEPQNAPDTVYGIEYTSTTATISPRMKVYADHIDYNGRTYDVAWWEIWIQASNGQWVGNFFLAPPNGNPLP